MKVEQAYQRAMETVVQWIHNEVNTNKTQVFFRTFAPVHFRFASLPLSITNISLVFWLVKRLYQCHNLLNQTPFHRHMLAWHVLVPSLIDRACYVRELFNLLGMIKHSIIKKLNKPNAQRWGLENWRNMSPGEIT